MICCAVPVRTMQAGAASATLGKRCREETACTNFLITGLATRERLRTLARWSAARADADQGLPAVK